MKERESEIVLTQEQKDREAYKPEMIGQALYDKLKDDPNYALMSMFCKNSGKLLAKKMEYEVPEKGEFERCILSYDNKMWSWDAFDVIALIVNKGYRDDRHRILTANVLFPDSSHRLMTIPMLSATRDEIMEFLRSPEFGPKQMTLLDEMNESMNKRD